MSLSTWDQRWAGFWQRRLERREPILTEDDYDWPTWAEIHAEEIAEEELYFADDPSW